EDFPEISVSNGIGELVAFCLQDTNQIQIGLTTATFFRGDRSSLLTEIMETKFERFSLPYDEYLRSMEHLQSFSYDFLLCDQDYSKAIGNLISQNVTKDIVYIPHPKSRHSTGLKYEEVRNIIEEYQKIHGEDIVETTDGLTRLNGDFKILDLVSEDRRDAKKQFINSNLIKDE